MKIVHEGVGRPIVNHTLRPIRISLTVPGVGEVAADESGYAVYFTNLPGYTFFIHTHRKSNKPGFALTEATTGRRVVWAPTSNEALDLGMDRLNDFLSKKGRAGFDRVIRTQLKVTEIKQGYDGTNDKSKPEPYEASGSEHPKIRNVPKGGDSNPERKGSPRPHIRIGPALRAPSCDRRGATAVKH